MAPQKKKVKLRKQKKKWFNVLASPEFKEQAIGETMAFEPESLIGRTVKVNLSSISREIRRQGKSITFKIKEVKESNAYTEIVRYEIPPMHVKRLVRKERDKVDDSFLVETKDNVKVRLKPLLLTRDHTQNSVKTALRKAVNELLKKEAKEKTYSELIFALVSMSLQKTMKTSLKIVYPLSLAEIRVMQKV
ncbi:MAG: hypothetical protein KKA65_00010 [Nanoarchaeota archaeon]|nr:hypothetical protein [Nanoarchaeota archaeon]MBU4241945.1 hypothetical protein [Nanoarchaeota archaeon]MBU4352365.1 hypothetical protein [Nanoarchaeota archaeon]MBU4455870.1 hypothetical protein [Nanoarchaeota archaeon]MCG2719491.1 hypothetical protein [Nanoarchaeota archaeon]